MRRNRTGDRARKNDLVAAIMAAMPLADAGDLLSALGAILRLHRASQLIDRALEADLGRFDVNRAQLEVLLALRTAGPPYCLSPTTLYTALLVSSGAMTNRLDRLAADGLVRRDPNPSDGRSVLVWLTPKGGRLVTRLLDEWAQLSAELLSRIAGPDVRTLSGILERLLAASEPVSTLVADAEAAPRSHRL